MNDNLKAFMELVSKNEELKDRILDLNKNITDPEENKEALIAMAAEYGAVLTEEDLSPKKEGAQPLSDDELEAVTGGYENRCSCVIGGGGSLDNHTCACVLYGLGKNNRDDHLCECHTVGFGYD